MDHTRQLGMLDPELIKHNVTVIGCGGIGSPTVFELALMGFPQITIIDPDSVEEHNRPSQMFCKSALGMKKVNAAARNIYDFVDECSITCIAKPIAEVPELSGIVISGVDSISTRHEIWNRLQYNTDISLYIDGRTAGDVVQIYTVEPCQIGDIDVYNDWLPKIGEKVSELPCTQRAIMYTGFGIAAFIGSQLKKWLKHESYYRRISFDYKTLSMAVT